MALIPTKLHAAGDYAGAILMLSAPRLLVSDRRALALLRVSGAAALGTSSTTDYELGVVRRIPMPAHLAIDTATGAGLLLSAMRLRRRGAGARNWLLVAILGLGEIAAAALTERQPGDKAGAATGVGGSEAPTTPSSPAGTMPEPVAATPPLETPGPSVTPPATPESDVERSERIDAALVDESASDDALVAKQEAAAAAEAAAIGGYAPSSAEDPAMEPVYQAGGGEQDGWEEAERDLIEHATHDDAGGDPTRDAFRPEVEADRATVVYGEADHVDSTEVVDDTSFSPEDPGQGPGLGSGRGGHPSSSG